MQGEALCPFLFSQHINDFNVFFFQAYWISTDIYLHVGFLLVYADESKKGLQNTLDTVICKFTVDGISMLMITSVWLQQKLFISH